MNRHTLIALFVNVRREGILITIVTNKNLFMKIMGTLSILRDVNCQMSDLFFALTSLRIIFEISSENKFHRIL